MPKVAQNTDEQKIPAHRSRHNFSLIGAKAVGGDLQIAGRIDHGPLKGKKITHLFRQVRPSDKRDFAATVGIPGTFVSLEQVVANLNERAPSPRFSATILKRIERWDTGREMWIPVESPPTEQAKFRYRYRLTDFEQPSAESELMLEESFYERRKQLERKRE